MWLDRSKIAYVVTCVEIFLLLTWFTSVNGIVLLETNCYFPLSIPLQALPSLIQRSGVLFFRTRKGTPETISYRVDCRPPVISNVILRHAVSCYKCEPRRFHYGKPFVAKFNLKA